MPVSAQVEAIKSAINENQIIIICGETGSGKSTQLPKICLDMGRGIFGRIAHTQPRRVAARTLASRIASELETQTGELVGYKVRFADKVKPHSRVKLLTDGMLLAEVQQDKFLNEYDTIIIDEAHERSLNIDFLLGYLKQLASKRRDLKIIITSATIDPEKFAEHFNDAPILMVSGRTYPVDTRYMPLDEDDDGSDPMQQGIVDAVDELSREGRGDILVFLSGEREIRETAETLRKQKLSATDILPLYARLSVTEQAKVFRTSGIRRIILATNVAETSLTVPGVRYVIDTGFARISRYSYRSKIQRLPIERISQASANQRMGRCGRVAEGICIRLYSEEDFQSRSEFTEAEIQRTNLAAVILQMKILGFGDIAKFPFVDPPDSRLIKDGYRVLQEIGAVNANNGLSNLGKKLAKLPVDPRVARIMLEGAQQGCLREMLIIGSLMSVQDPRDRPVDKQQQADEAHALFKNEQSDFLGFVAMWDYIQEKRKHLSRAKFRKMCRQHFLSSTRIQEWIDIHKQLASTMHEMSYKENSDPAHYDAVHYALLTGLLSHVGLRSDENHYLGARNSRFYIFPGSALFKEKPKWLLAGELVETSKLYARTVAMVQPAWIERAAGHLLSHNYSEPHWQAKRAQVGGYEKVTLWGLVLTPRRHVNYGSKFPIEAREIFIRFALVEEDYKTRAPFFRHNHELIEEIHQIEQKTRRHDVLVSDEVRYEFYDQRIPEGIFTGAAFEKWLKGLSKAESKTLFMNKDDLINQTGRDDVAQYYPSAVSVNNTVLPLDYAFDPGKKDDGISMKIPLALINQVPLHQGDWLVPGLLEEKVTAMIKALPKAIRKQFVPVPDYARDFVQAVTVTDQPLHQVLAEYLKKRKSIHIEESEWNSKALPDHLRMNYKVLDNNGKIIAQSRDLIALKQKYRDQAASSLATLSNVDDSAREVTEWDFGELAEYKTVKRNGIEIKLYPALVEHGKTVRLELLDSLASAQMNMRKGLRRLVMLNMAKDIRYLKKNLPNIKTMALHYAKAPKPGKGQATELADELLALIIEQAFVEPFMPVRNKQAFEQALVEGKKAMMQVANDRCALLAGILKTSHQLRKDMSNKTQINWLASINDIKEHMDQLIYRGFILEESWSQIEQYPRYLKALVQRLEKLNHAAARDQQYIREMSKFYQRWKERYVAMKKEHRHDERLEEIRWMIEEWRISLFAQQIKTRYPISLKRLQKRWMDLGL